VPGRANPEPSRRGPADPQPAAPVQRPRQRRARPRPPQLAGQSSMCARTLRDVIEVALVDRLCGYVGQRRHSPPLRGKRNAARAASTAPWGTMVACRGSASSMGSSSRCTSVTTRRPISMLSTPVMRRCSSRSGSSRIRGRSSGQARSTSTLRCSTGRTSLRPGSGSHGESCALQPTPSPWAAPAARAPFPHHADHPSSGDDQNVPASTPGALRVPLRPASTRSSW
jgi:hypothetical protein